MAKATKDINKDGLLIVGMGIPACGKSTLFKGIESKIKANGYKCKSFLEPEEKDWPAAVKSRDECGHITALTWFRATRVPMLFEAEKLKNMGGVALIDSYYDKLIHLYLEDPSMNWLLDKEDAYRATYEELIRIDYRNLPDADCVVTITLEKEIWQERMRNRGRDLDEKSNVGASYPSQEAMLRAARIYSSEKDIPHLVFNNDKSDEDNAIQSLYNKIIEAGIIR